MMEAEYDMARESTDHYNYYHLILMDMQALLVMGEEVIYVCTVGSTSKLAIAWRQI